MLLNLIKYIYRGHRRRMEREAKAKVVAAACLGGRFSIPCRASCFASVHLEEKDEFNRYFHVFYDFFHLLSDPSKMFSICVRFIRDFFDLLLECSVIQFMDGDLTLTLILKAWVRGPSYIFGLINPIGLYTRTNSHSISHKCSPGLTPSLPGPPLLLFLGGPLSLPLSD